MMMGGFDQDSMGMNAIDDKDTNNDTSYIHDNEENQEEIDFDQLLGDAAQSQVEDEEDRDDQDFDDDESEE